jgi:ADP-ribose pyrophosphatase
MLEYTVSLAIDSECVALVKKKKPEWQLGKFNGIGGHVENNETIERANIREFYEETAYASSKFSWKHFATFQNDVINPNIKVHFFVSNNIKLNELSKENDRGEKIELISISQIFQNLDMPLVPHLQLAMFMALNCDTHKTVIIPELNGD